MSKYDVMMLRGKTLMEWAILWFNTNNDAFYKCYGFNFNPFKYEGLYEQARKKVYGYN